MATTNIKGWLLGISDTRVDAALLLLRIWFGLTLALAHGLGKVTGLDQFTAGVTQMGFPAPGLLALLAALSEFLGGLLLAVGLLTRPAAIMILTTMLVAALKVHAADPFMKKELAFAMAIVAAAILLAGPGRYSLDWKLFGARALRSAP